MHPATPTICLSPRPRQQPLSNDATRRVANSSEGIAGAAPAGLLGRSMVQKAANISADSANGWLVFSADDK
jgi:hypothetical protein